MSSYWSSFDELNNDRNGWPWSYDDKMKERNYCSSSLDTKFAHLRIPLEDILLATKNFAEENLLKRIYNDYFYVGVLLRSNVPINVVIWRFVASKSVEDAHEVGGFVKKFTKEISILSRVKHRNVASLIGFCDEKDERMIVMEHAAKGCLDTNLNGQMVISCAQSLHICFGVALGLRYIKKDIKHVDVCNRFIKSSNIMLDGDLQPKILCTGFSFLGDVCSWYDSESSYVYSLGTIFLEVLCRPRKTRLRDVYDYLARIEETGYEEVCDMIDPNLRERMHPRSLSIFLETVYGCFKSEERYDIHQIVDRLKEALEIQWEHENLPQVIAPFANLKMLLSRIKSATNDFANAYCINSDIDDMVCSKNQPLLTFLMHELKLDHFEKESVSSTEGDNNDELSQKTSIAKSHRDLDMVYLAQPGHFDEGKVLKIKGEIKGDPSKKTVIIKRVINQKYKKITKTSKEFFAEIAMLTSFKHPNLVSLIGFCDEDSEMILVFECAFKQSLDDYLVSTSKTTNISWEQRIRVCLDIAYGLTYLQNMDDKHCMTHQGILSANVVLDENWTAKLANFRVSNHKTFHASWQPRLENFRTWLWDNVDAPWILPNQRIVVDDIYCLGVILFEVLTGRLAYDPFYMGKNCNGLASMVRRHFNEGKLKDIVDPKIMEETREYSYTLKIGPDQDSFATFSKIAYQCLEETQSERPKLEVVIKSLEKALDFQSQNLEHLTIPLEYIHSATENFNTKYFLGSGGYGEVYKAELNYVNIRRSLATKMHNKTELSKAISTTVAIKRIFKRDDNVDKETFLAELDTLSRCEHPNIVSLLGFCVEGDEMLLVYEFASNGSLEAYWENPNKVIDLTWAQRLKICIGIAEGLKYMHTTMEDKMRIIHRDIKSANILLGVNWEAKIADFGLSRVHHGNQAASTINTIHVAGTNVYLDPEYVRTGKLKKESDIYSLGVVLFEIFSGKLAYDSSYITKNEKGLAPVARNHFKNGTLKKILDQKIMDEVKYELGVCVQVGPDHDSLDAFSKIANQCLAKTQADRPTIEVVIEKLKASLYFQENQTLKISLEHIKSDIENFGECIMKGGYGMLYKGNIRFDNQHKKVLVKRFSHDWYLNDARYSWEHGFLKEFEVLFKYKHESIIALEGYCKEMEEKIIIYEYASNGSLDGHLNDASFTWTQRLKICLDIAKGLNFLHGGDNGRDVMIHRDIKSSNILLTEDWKAKICGFEHAVTYPRNKKIKYVVDNVESSPGYNDPLFQETHFLTKESDIYSFGVILFEILCGRLALPKDFRDRSQLLDVVIKGHLPEAPFDDMVFDGIKEQICTHSLNTFGMIAFECLSYEREKRPTAAYVVAQLQKALELQEAYETPESKFRSNEKDIPSTSRKINSAMAKKEIYDILSKGLLLEDDKQEIIRVLQTTCDHEKFTPEEEDYQSEPIMSMTIKRKRSRRRN